MDFEENGISNPPDEHGAPGAITTFNQNHFPVHTAEGALLLEGTFELDASAKTVDWVDAIGPGAGETLPAIYKLEGDHFVFIAADAGAPRPTEFCTGAGQTMRSFARRSQNRLPSSLPILPSPLRGPKDGRAAKRAPWRTQNLALLDLNVRFSPKRSFASGRPNVRFARRSQWVDATPAANLTSGDLTLKVFLDPSFARRAT